MPEVLDLGSAVLTLQDQNQGQKMAERWMRLVWKGTVKHNQQQGTDQPMPTKPLRASCAGIADNMYVLCAEDVRPALLPDVLDGRHRSDSNPLCMCICSVCHLHLSTDTNCHACLLTPVKKLF